MHVFASGQNNQISTVAGREHCDVDIGSQCANTTSVSHDFEDVGNVKPLLIVPCWSEAATQEADFSSSERETTIAR